MAKQKIEFESFLEAAGSEHAGFITEIHDTMLVNECTYVIKEAKSGYVLSYIHQPSQRTVANYVFRKKGPMIRIYGDYVEDYAEILQEWPEPMKQSIIKAGVCKRLLDPDACSPKCLMGFRFVLDGQEMKKCRNNCFMFFLSEDTNPHLQQMVANELQHRKQAAEIVMVTSR